MSSTQQSDEGIPVVMVLGTSRYVLSSKRAAQIILWVADHQADLDGCRGSWTFDHSPGTVSVTRLTKEKLAE